jgi:hypothetical protein
MRTNKEIEEMWRGKGFVKFIKFLLHDMVMLKERKTEEHIERRFYLMILSGLCL